MTTNEIITELVSYNLGTYEESELISNGFKQDVDASGREYWHRTEDYSTYLTDLNILHRVAVKVYGEFRVLSDMPKDFHDVRFKIYYSLLQEPINGEYIELATATAEAIIYLKKYKP
jgi:hypothetical protein